MGEGSVDVDHQTFWWPTIGCEGGPRILSSRLASPKPPEGHSGCRTGHRPKLPLKIWQAPSAMESLSASSLDKADAQKCELTRVISDILEWSLECLHLSPIYLSGPYCSKSARQTTVAIWPTYLLRGPSTVNPPYPINPAQKWL